MASLLPVTLCLVTIEAIVKPLYRLVKVVEDPPASFNDRGANRLRRGPSSGMPRRKGPDDGAWVHVYHLVAHKKL